MYSEEAFPRRNASSSDEVVGNRQKHTVPKTMSNGDGGLEKTSINLGCETNFGESDPSCNLTWSISGGGGIDTNGFGEKTTVVLINSHYCLFYYLF